MSTAFSADVSGRSIDVEIQPATHYSPPVLTIRQQTGSFQLHADPEQLAELEYTIRTFLDGIRYPETPDQQTILNHEIKQSIKEGIA
ncbi:hypothetical protein AMS62_03315 [Bacillus sp. FJAT-18019]|nr:hypothetical protein AMS62_03315 [Bacillus sp. FJAT-18019]